MFNKHLLSMIVLAKSILPVMASMSMGEIRNYNKNTDLGKRIISQQDITVKQTYNGTFSGLLKKSKIKYYKNIIIKKNQKKVDDNYIVKSFYTTNNEQKHKDYSSHTKKMLKTNVVIVSKMSKTNVTALYNKSINRKYSFLGVVNHKDSNLGVISHKDSKVGYNNDIIGKEYRRPISNNYITKGIYTTDKGQEFKLTVMNSPDTTEMFKEKIKNSGHSINGGEYHIFGELNHNVKSYVATTKIGFTSINNKVKHDEDNHLEWQKYGDENYNSHISSMQSDYDKWDINEQTISLKQDYSAPSFNKKGNQHTVSFGWGVDITNVKFNRDKDTSSYNISENTFSRLTFLQTWKKNADSNVRDSDTKITKLKKRMNINKRKIKNLQNRMTGSETDSSPKSKYLNKLNARNTKFMNSFKLNQKRNNFLRSRRRMSEINLNKLRRQMNGRKTVYKAKKISVNDHILSAYIQDKINISKVEITGGLRFDRTALLNNNNIAPRLSSVYTYNNTTRIFGGINRYYSSSILSYILNDHISANTGYARIKSGAWLKKDSFDGGSFANGKNLKTPYSDELNLGLTKSFGNVTFTLKGVYRNGKDQFVKTKVANGIYELNNKGKSKDHTLSFQANGLKPITVSKGILMSWNVETSYSKSIKNFNPLWDKITPEIFTQKVIFDGELINSNDMPVLNYNSPIRGSANLNFYIPKYNLMFGNTIKYRAGYNGYTRNSFTCDSTEPVCGGFSGLTKEYTKTTFDSSLDLDLHLIYRLKKTKNLAITIDVMNVFNKTQDDNLSAINNSSIESNYSRDRIIWAGIKYYW